MIDADAPILRDDPDPGTPANTSILRTVEGIRALVVPVEGAVREVVLTARDRDGYLGDLRDHVGAEWLDVIQAETDGMSLTMWVDDEGLLNARASNSRIGDLLVAVLGLVDAPFVCGDVVITGPPDEYGATTGLAREARDELIARWS